MRVITKEIESIGSQPVISYTLINTDIKISFLNIGCAITEILVPDRQGNMENIVLSYANTLDYFKNPSYQGCIVGPTSGRISKGRFFIDDVEYNIDQNDGCNNLHGGTNGLSKKIWMGKVYELEDRIGVIFTYVMQDLEGGYPGNRVINVDYSLNKDNKFVIQVRGTTDKATIINMTNHSYFNLAGMKDSILNHNIYMDTKGFCEIDDKLIPTGKIINNGDFDFNSSHSLNEELVKDSVHIRMGGIDHPFLVKDSKTVELSYELNGRRLRISSNQPIVVVYTSNVLGDESRLRNNTVGSKYLGVCFEMQDYPDGINQENFPCKIYREGELYENIIEYKFDTI